jgi:cyclic pyranopterin phosphate synthase
MCLRQKLHGIRSERDPKDKMPLVDSYNRTIDYLRISVTDRCNFRCIYCMPEEGAPVAPKADILSFEEIERLVRIAISLGMTKIRLTGGEPLVRKDIDRLVQKIGALPGLRDLSMTTNGFLLARHAAEFAANGLNRINISLDTLRPDRFARLARRGNLDDVLRGIDAATNAGLTPIKLNCVAMRGWNDDEVVDFARLTLEQPFDVRFIELMPINWSRGDDSAGEMEKFFALSAARNNKGGSQIQLYANSELATFRDAFHSTDPQVQTGQLDAAQMRRAFISTDEIRQRIEGSLGPLHPAEIVTNGPARSFRLDGACGTVGFISQITNDMCQNCNRLRLTADGMLRPCLMADGEVDLRTPLRDGSGDEAIEELFRLTVFHKPREHRLEDGVAPIGRNMSQLGG